MDHETGDDPTNHAALHGERPSKRRRTATQPAREVGLMRSVPGDKFPSFVGSASGIYFIRSVYAEVGRANPTASLLIQAPESDIVPGEDDHLPSVLPNASGGLWSDDEVTSRSLSHVSVQELVDWSASYFANWHPAYPFLHAPSILEYLEEIAHKPLVQENVSQEFRLTTIRSIMSISLADRRQSQMTDGNRYPADLVFKSYDHAMDSLQRVLSRPTSIHSLQTAISVQLFLVSMLRLNAASRLGGLVIRMALQLGLHRCPNRFPTFSVSDRELRQRIFWSLYSIDRFICQSMGLPFSLHDDDIDVCYPTAESHSEGQHRSDSRLRLLDLLARQAWIRGQMMELRHKSLHYVHKDPDRQTVITAKLAQWWNDVEELIDSDDGQLLSSYHLTVLTVLKNESVISLNRPILAASRQGPAYDAALQHCIGSARTIITTLHKVTNNEVTSENQNENMSLLWPSCTWAVWISTFILFHAANSKHISPNVVSRFAERSLDVLQHLARRGSVWPEACAAAIRNLRAQMTRRQPKNPNQDRGPSVVAVANGQAHQPSGSSHQRTSAHDSSMPHIHAASGHSTENPSIRSDTSTRPNTNQNASPALRFIASTSSSTVMGEDSGGEAQRLPGLSQSSITSDSNPLSTPGITAAAPLGFGEGANLDDFIQGSGSLDYTSMLPAVDCVDPFSGFDIPFWLGQDQDWGVLHEWQ